MANQGLYTSEDHGPWGFFDNKEHNCDGRWEAIKDTLSSITMAKDVRVREKLVNSLAAELVLAHKELIEADSSNVENLKTRVSKLKGELREATRALGVAKADVADYCREVGYPLAEEGDGYEDFGGCDDDDIGNDIGNFNGYDDDDDSYEDDDDDDFRVQAPVRRRQAQPW